MLFQLIYEYYLSYLGDDTNNGEYSFVFSSYDYIEVRNYFAIISETV